MDVPGFNYRVYKYNRNIAQLPAGFLLGTETASTVSSRGVYKFPVRWGVAEADSDGQVSSYDTQWCSWSNLTRRRLHRYGGPPLYHWTVYMDWD